MKALLIQELCTRYMRVIMCNKRDDAAYGEINPGFYNYHIRLSSR